MQRLDKHVPRATYWRTTIEVLLETGCFYMVRAEELSWKLGRRSQFKQFCMGFCEEKTWVQESEASALLWTAARERLVKTQKSGKGLAGAVVIIGFWRLSVAP
jgi:hypothetical protein